jgi:hypothetical protein
MEGGPWLAVKWIAGLGSPWVTKETRWYRQIRSRGVYEEGLRRTSARILSLGWIRVLTSVFGTVCREQVYVLLSRERAGR